MKELIECSFSGVDTIKFNQPYFYDRLFALLKEDGVNIMYGDFSSRILKNGAIKVFKSLGLYVVVGARENKRAFIHEKLSLIINTTIVDSSLIIKTVIDLVDGKYRGIAKFECNDLSKFYLLENDYPHSIDVSKCTYIIYNKESKLHKIGRSSNVFDRLNSLRNEFNPSLELVGYLDTDIEGLLHKEYAHKRKFGEWFDLTLDDILDLKLTHNFIILQMF